MAVVIGAATAASAVGSEVLASSTVKDLTAGSGLEVPGHGHARPERCAWIRWRIFRVVGEHP